jgi:outer membrane immunogenic protein
MRKFFHATTTASLLLVASVAANAADLPMRQPPPPAPPPVYVQPVFSWSGFYLGGNIGGAWAQRNWTDSVLGLNFNNGTSNGVFIGGGQVGVNAQFGSFVIGAEWDFDWSGNNNNNTGNGLFVPALGTLQVTSNNTWISTVAARFGVAFDRVLLYGKAGGGWVGNNGFTITNVTTGASITGSNSNTSSGWLLGAGLEWAFLPSWTVKFEYDYLGLSNRSFVVPVGAPFLAGDTFTSNNRNVQMVKVGFNYLFNWGSPVRY